MVYLIALLGTVNKKLVCVCVRAPGNKGNSTTVLVKIEFTRYHHSVVPIHCIHMLQRVGVLLCD